MILDFKDFKVNVITKKIKSMRMMIKPPDGEVYLSVSPRRKESEIRNFILSKKDWIIENQKKIRSQKISFDDGFGINSEIWFFGKKYKLIVQIVKTATGVQFDSGRILIKTKVDSPVAVRKILDKWYKNKLLDKCKEHVLFWEKKLKVKVEKISVRNMHTRWGSCTPSSRAIRINLNLVYRGEHCLSMIILHEMIHFKEASHNSRFYAFMDKYMPDWKIAKKALLSFPDTREECS